MTPLYVVTYAAAVLPGVQPGVSFTNMPYVLNSGTGCGQNSVIVMGHEIEETITDPGAEDLPVTG